jgi:hypothetical protein
MEEFHRGEKLTIWLTQGTRASWDAAEADVPGNRKSCLTQFRARLARLADFGTLRSPDHMNNEGDGIYAVKATCGLRAYGWFDQVNGRRSFIISHCILKRRQAADPADLERARNARAQYKQRANK